MIFNHSKSNIVISTHYPNSDNSSVRYNGNGNYQIEQLVRDENGLVKKNTDITFPNWRSFVKYFRKELPEINK